jgi:hypothetical protein
LRWSVFQKRKKENISEKLAAVREKMTVRVISEKNRRNMDPDVLFVRTDMAFYRVSNL